jgi:hypothetical protein
MGTPFCNIVDLTHIDSSQLQGRSVVLAPLWDGCEWKSWVPVDSGRLVKLSIVDVAQSHYLAKEAENEKDIHIPFVELMWQHMSWPDIWKSASSLSQDIHLFATSAAKLEHFYEARDQIDRGLIAAFVNSEIEHMLVVARSMFDLLQEVLAKFWNNHVRLIDGELERSRKQRPMQTTFSKTVLEKEALRTAEQIAQKYSIPTSTAQMYAKHAPFFKSVRGARDSIVHFGKTPDSVFVTNRGFCVNPKAPYFSDFVWSSGHYYNENIVTLVPWLSWLVGGTLEACSDILFSLSGQIQFPPPLAPDHHLFLRDPSNPALLRLARAAQDPDHWWREPRSNINAPHHPAAPT